ncbi:hypothetical protein [Salinicola endophyticus]|uniref:Uncharacterized protein n=1 Tax=Salinicola endophyticus TaxID=1949083 RepID=A0AB74U246_9GAMM
MATRKGGVQRRSKGGRVEQVSAPTVSRKYGSHAEHPSRATVPAPSPTKALAKSTQATQVKDDE